MSAPEALPVLAENLNLESHSIDTRLAIPVFEKSFDAMGCKVKVLIMANSEELLERAVERIHHLDQIWSRFRADSEISRLNLAEGASVEVSPETSRLVEAMIWAQDMTEGVFDATVLPILVENGYRNSRVNAELETVLPDSATWPGNLRATELDGNRMKLARGTVIDSGGLGKGLAADLVVSGLMAGGAASALVQIGGDLRFEGIPPSAEKWLIGIENPFDTESNRSVLKINNGAVCTSSALKRLLKNDPALAHHLIDPASGSSMNSSVATVSVVAPTALEAEIATKPGFVWDTRKLSCSL